MKTIENGTIIKIKGWKGTSEVAEVMDMGLDKDFRGTDENRIFGAPRSIMLCNNKKIYEEEDRKYAYPIEVEDGEIVVLKANGKQYRVKNMAGGSNWAYYSDILHFELVR